MTCYTDRNGRVVEYLYDEDERILQERWFTASQDPDVDAPIHSFIFTYDDSHGGGIATVQEGHDANDDGDFEDAGDTLDLAFSYTYDAGAYLTQTVWDFGSISGSDDVIFDYDYSRGERIGTQATIGTTADYQNAYAYDAFGRLVRIEQTGQAGGNPVAAKGVDFTYNFVRYRPFSPLHVVVIRVVNSVFLRASPVLV